MTRVKIPDFAKDFPEMAQSLVQTRLPFYCINCQHKRETTYLTPDFGPFCDECLKEAEKVTLIKALMDQP